MKLYGLYLAEANEADGEEQGESGIGKILAAAFKGIAKALLLLTAVIVHGLLGKAVIAGRISSKDALKAGRLNRDKKFEEYYKKRGRNTTSDEADLKDEIQRLEEEFDGIIEDITSRAVKRGDVKLERKARSLTAKWLDSDGDESPSSVNNLADDDGAVVKTSQAKLLLIKKLIAVAKKLQEQLPTAPEPKPEPEPEPEPQKSVDDTYDGYDGDDGDLTADTDGLDINDFS